MSESVIHLLQLECNNKDKVIQDLKQKYDTLLMELAESKLNIAQLQYNNKLLIESLEFYAEAKRDVLDWDRGNEARYTLGKLGLWKP